MQLGRVIGTVVPSVRCEGLEGVRFLIVQPLDRTGEPVRTLDAASAAMNRGSVPVMW